MGKKDRWHFDFESKRAKRHRGLDIEAFQRLWNRNQPDDPISEDGGWGENTEKALKRAPVRGFAPLRRPAGGAGLSFAGLSVMSPLRLANRCPTCARAR